VQGTEKNNECDKIVLAHRERTESAQRAHRERTESAQRAHRERTESAQRAHREQQMDVIRSYCAWRAHLNTQINREHK
jgi:hypothetical protein